MCADGPLREERRSPPPGRGRAPDRFSPRATVAFRSQIRRLIRDSHVALSRGRAKPGAVVTALVVNVSVRARRRPFRT